MKLKFSKQNFITIILQDFARVFTEVTFWNSAELHVEVTFIPRNTAEFSNIDYAELRFFFVYEIPYMGWYLKTEVHFVIATLKFFIKSLFVSTNFYENHIQITTQLRLLIVTLKPTFIVNLRASDLLGNTTKVRPTS
jgi:hypothetical protein